MNCLLIRLMINVAALFGDVECGMWLIKKVMVFFFYYFFLMW